MQVRPGCAFVLEWNLPFRNPRSTTGMCVLCVRVHVCKCVGCACVYVHECLWVVRIAVHVYVCVFM